MKQWLFLAIAIVSEIIATSTLKASDGFTRLWPTVVVLVCYGIAFYALSLALRTMPVGVAYAVWSGVGVLGPEAFDAVPFLDLLTEYGSPWDQRDDPQ